MLKRSSIRLCITSLMVAGFVSSATGQGLVDAGLDPATENEIRYANILKGWGMPDLAMMVLSRIKDPAAQMKIKVIELESMIYMGKWAEVKAKVAAIPDQGGQEAWAMKLALADGYYAWGKYAQAQEIYDTFLARFPGGPPPKIKEFFFNSVYKYAQMLILMGNKPGAIAAYEQLLNAKPPDAVARQVTAEMAEMMITLMEAGKGNYKSKLEDAIKKLFWKQDLWFSKAIVLRAHVHIMDGEVDKAMRIIDDYKQQLLDMDKILKEEEEKTGQPMSKLSPMAECRYLIATMMKSEADTLLKSGGDRERIKVLLVGKKMVRGTGKNRKEYRTDGALQHFYNVFLQYPNTPWAPDAGIKAKAIKEMLEAEFGADINIEVGPEQWAKVEKAQFQEARSLFNQNQHKQAIAAYLRVMNAFPESETGVAALGELARCYVELKDDVMFDTTAHYLAERFGRNKQYFVKAGDVTLRLGAYMAEIGAPEKKAELMDLYFKKCPTHPSVPVMVMKRAAEKMKAEDFGGAADDYRLVEDRYADTIVYETALNKRSICLFKIDKKVEGIKVLTKYMKLLEGKSQIGTPLLSAYFRLGQMYRNLDKKYIPTAFKYYKKVVKLMEDEKHRAHETLSNNASNKSIYEGALFYQGVCYVQLDKPEQNIKAYRKQAIKFFEDLVTKFPESIYGPQCLLQMGVLYTVLDDTDKAGNALERLQKEYPDSDEAANSDYIYASGLLKSGRTKAATKVFARMFEGDGTYSDQQILTAALALLKDKRYEIALQAFEKLKKSKVKSMKQRVMLGLGECYAATGEAPKTVEVLEQMLEQFPGTGHTPAASTFLSKAYGDLAMEEADALKRKLMFNKAVIAEKTVRKYQNTAGGKKWSDLRVGLILKKKALAEEKFGNPEAAKQYKGKAAVTFQTIVMFTEPKTAELGNIIQEAYMESVPLLAELEMWRDVVEGVTKYIEDFPAPKGKYTSQMRSLRNKAKVRMATMDNPEGEEEDLVEDVAPILYDENGDVIESEEAPAAPAPAPAPAEKKAAAPVAPAPVVKKKAPAPAPALKKVVAAPAPAPAKKKKAAAPVAPAPVAK